MVEYDSIDAIQPLIAKDMQQCYRLTNKKQNLELTFRIQNAFFQNQSIITEGSDNLQLDALTLTPIIETESKGQLTKINDLIGTFDGFEKWLYTDTQYSDSLSYPKSGNAILASSNSTSIAWYNSTIQVASTYDRNNVNYLNNNLPEFIKEDYQNDDYTVRVFDALTQDQLASVEIDQLGNLFTTAPIDFNNGITVDIINSSGSVVKVMSTIVTNGQCNLCHDGQFEEVIEFF